MSNLTKAALAIRASGISIIPSGRNKQPAWWLLPVKTDEHGQPILNRNGKPKHTWQPYQSEMADEATIKRWFASDGINISIVCGTISGNLLVLDFDYDAAKLYKKWCQLIPDELLARLVIVTSGKGYHVYFRLEAEAEVPGGTILAKRPKTGGQPGEHDVLIELRAEGNLCTAPPSYHYGRKKHYRATQGSLLALPVLAQNEAESLILAAKSLNQVEERERPTQSYYKSTASFHRLDKSRAGGYARAALDNMARELAMLSQGSRNRNLNDVAFWLGRYAGAGLLEVPAIKQALEAACTQNGLIDEDGYHSFDATFHSGIQSGLQNPFTEPELMDKIQTPAYTHPHLDNITPPLTDEQKRQITAVIHEIQQQERWKIYHQALTPSAIESWQMVGIQEPIMDRYGLGYSSQHNCLTLPMTDQAGQVIDIEYRSPSGQSFTYECSELPSLHFVQPLFNEPIPNTGSHLIILDDATTAITSYLAYGHLHIDQQPLTFAGLPHLRLRPESVASLNPDQAWLLLSPGTDATGRGATVLRQAGVRVVRLPFAASKMRELGIDGEAFLSLLSQAKSL